MLRVGVTEIDIAYEDKETSGRRCIEVMKQARDNGVELLVFPEMTLAGFTMKPERMSEAYSAGRIPESISFFMKNSRQYGMAMAFGYIEASMADGSPEFDAAGKKIYQNKLAIVDGENLIMDYSKIHPFSISGEDRVYHAGDRLCQAKLKDVRLGGYICYDLRFPEIFSAVRDNYDAAVVIANWPEQRVPQWEALLRARAIENQAYVIGVNRVGSGNGQNYIPSSHVFDCYGSDVARRVSSDLLIADVDSAAVKAARSVFPQSRDRKPDFYRSILN